MNRVLTIFLLSLVMLSSSAFAQPRLEFGETSEFELMWNDAGSGADRDGAFYRPRPPRGFFTLGDYGQGNYDPPSEIVIVVRAVGEDPVYPLLKPPVDWKPIWADHGSGADRDGSFWAPIPPDGYLCIGSVAQTGYDKPNDPNYRCVRRDWVEPGDIRDLIWNDQGSGADADVAVYGLAGTNVIHAVPTYEPLTGPVYMPRGL